MKDTIRGKNDVAYSPFDPDKPDWNKVAQKYNKKYGHITHLDPAAFTKALGHWYTCVTRYMGELTTSIECNQQLTRSDLDTICGLELRNLQIGVSQHGILGYDAWAKKNAE